MNGANDGALELPVLRAESILLDEAGLLVVEKPPFVAVHGGDERYAGSLVLRLRSLLRGLSDDREIFVHSRLDEGTSGAMLLSSSAERNAELGLAFAEHRILRRYVALVEYGERHRLLESGTIELKLEHHRGITRVSPRGDRAVTHYRILRRKGRRALLELSLETGRTHQIRASLAHWGAPIVGDAVYGGPAAYRIFLHSVEVSGGPLPRRVVSPLPGDFEGELLEPSGFPASTFRERLAYAALRRAPITAFTEAFRLVNGEGDGLPGITVEVYGCFAVLNVYDDRWLPWLPTWAEELAKLGIRGAYLKERVRTDPRRADAQTLAQGLTFFGDAAPSVFPVSEHGMKILVQLQDGMSTGLFLDQRENRLKLRELCGPGARVLNLFSYTGSFSVAAALSGAHTTSVDLSGRALARTKENFEQNGLSPEPHRFVKEDAMKYLARAQKRGERFDFIVLDPPSFATVGKGTFSAARELGAAITSCVHLLREGGTLLTVTNHNGTSEERLAQLQRQAASALSLPFTVTTGKTGADFPKIWGEPWPSKSSVLKLH